MKPTSSACRSPTAPSTRWSAASDLGHFPYPDAAVAECLRTLKAGRRLRLLVGRAGPATCPGPVPGSGGGRRRATPGRPAGWALLAEVLRARRIPGLLREAGLADVALEEHSGTPVKSAQELWNCGLGGMVLAAAAIRAQDKATQDVSGPPSSAAPSLTRRWIECTDRLQNRLRTQARLISTAPAELWPWLALAGLGAFHGLNPAMGWLFAVALGLHRQSRARCIVSLLPIARACALDRDAAGPLVAAGRPAQPGADRLGLLLGWAAYHWRFGHRHRVRFGMQTGLLGLAPGPS